MSKKKPQPISVGEYLDKELAGQNKSEFAKRLGISRRQLYNLLGNKRRLTFEVAKSLGEATGHSPAFWLQLELDYLLHAHGAQ